MSKENYPLISNNKTKIKKFTENHFLVLRRFSMRYFKRHYITSVMKKVNKDVLEARWAIIFIIAYFVFLKHYFYSTCPVVIVTGFPCPMCGMTRAAFQLMHFDFKGAFTTQPFIYAVVLIVLFFIFDRYILLRNTQKWLTWILILCIISMICFYIWRMIMCFPGEPPMSYYPDNLLAKIFDFIK